MKVLVYDILYKDKKQHYQPFERVINIPDELWNTGSHVDLIKNNIEQQILFFDYKEID